jgi:hypothetical protein
MLEAGYIRKVVYYRINCSGLVCRMPGQMNIWHRDEQTEIITRMESQKIELG